MLPRAARLIACLLLAACTPPRASETPSEVTIPPAPQPMASAAPSASVAPAEPPPEEAATPPESAAEKHSEPPPEATSKSGKLTAFVKNGNELWLKERNVGERKLVPSGSLTVQNPKANLPPLDESGDLSALAFSPDEKRVYFMRTGWATSSALFYVEVDTGKLFFFHDSNGYKVISTCSNKAHVGRIINFEHSYFDVNPTGAFDLFTLLDATPPAPGEQRTGASGRRGLIGSEDHNLIRFLARECGEGKAPPATPEVIPPKMRVSPLRCQGQTLRRDDLRFLDGTSLIRYRLSNPKKDDLPPIMLLSEVIVMCES